MRGLIGLAAALSLTCGVAWAAPAVSVTATTSHHDGTSQVTVTVSVSGLGAGQEWKDLHLFPARKHSFPKLEGGTNVTVTPQGGGNSQTWTRKGSTHQVVQVYTDGAAGFGNGTYTFTLNFKGDRAGNPVTWDATDNGSKKYRTGDVIDNNENQPAPNFPQAKATVNDDNEKVIATGAVAQLTVATDTDLQGSSYEVYSSVSLNPDFEDALGIGINNSTAPVPASWNLTFQNFTGTIDPGGTASPLPQIVVPADPSLVGKEFYVVFAVKAGTDILFASSPIRVRIVAP